MKLIVDIPEDELTEDEIEEAKRIADDCFSGVKTIIPDNATNGDVIKAMFPNTEVDDYDYGKDPVIDVYGIDDTEYITLRKVWWNSPYQKGGK